MTSPISKRLISIVASTFVLACAGLPLQVEDIPLSAAPSEEVGRLEEKLEAARQLDTQSLAPTWFANAEASLDEARRLLSEGESVESILGNVAEGLAQLERAEEFAEITRVTLPRAIEAREDARAAGAPALGAPYTRVEQRFLELTRAVENDDTSWAKSKQDAVASTFRDVELQAIKETTLKEVRDLIAKARADDAERLAPTILAQAETRLAEADQFITQNRYARSRANELAQSALFEAQRLSHSTAEAKRIRSTSAEALYLEEEHRLHELAQSLGLPDLRNQSPETRREALLRGTTELRNDRNYLVERNRELRSEVDETQQRIAQLEGETAAEQQEVARLEAERRFNELYDEVSAYFEPGEAEVYKQGQQLVIRLRQVQFPVGEHVLQPDSYQLLSKVQRAIRAFGDPRVVIEGHTDATGSAEFNDHLSELRADAVRDYLVANETIDPDQIAAVGRGFGEPLASNRTPEGRAQNRRIDVTISATYYGAESPLPQVAAPPVSER